MKNIDSKGHVTGNSIYLDDIPVIQGTLHGVVFYSSCAHGTIDSVDYSEALKYPGVKQILTYKDIPGENQIGGIFPDEPLFAKSEVHFQGQPIALVLAETEEVGHHARELIKISFTQKEIVVDPRIAQEKDLLIFPPRTFKLGDV
ncbi:MAG: xanthine dehydrogenase large subunit, partial [Crocinitomicaceae bacterium]